MAAYRGGMGRPYAGRAGRPGQRGNITPKQRAYLRDLLIRAGIAHPRGFLRAEVKALPHRPSNRLMEEGVDAWLNTLTVQQASELIDYLRRG